MNTIRKFSRIFLAMAALALAACTAHPDPYVRQGRRTGTVVGGISGAVIGNNTGLGSWGGAAAGAALGGILGNTAGKTNSMYHGGGRYY